MALEVGGAQHVFASQQTTLAVDDAKLLERRCWKVPINSNPLTFNSGFLVAR
jgi:hypothetical protein